MIRKRIRVVEGSCSHCRRRRVVCDLQKPACRKCVTSQHSCDYEAKALKWVNGAAIKGPRAPVKASGTAHGRPLSLTPALHDEQLVSYFENMVLPRFNLSTAPLSADVHAIRNDPALWNVILTIAAAHFKLYGKVTLSYTTLATRKARLDVMTQYRKRLENTSTSSFDAQYLFMTAGYLCLLDGVIEPSEEATASLIHLDGGKAILDRWNHLPETMLTRKGLQAHLLSNFATVDLFRCILRGQMPYFESRLWAKFATIDCWWGNLPVGDQFLTIMATFSDLALIGCSKRPRGHRGSISEVLDSTEALGMEELNQRSMTAAPEEHADQYAEPWALFCSAYRVSTVIYVYRALLGLPKTDRAVQNMVHEGVHALCGKQLQGKLSSCLLFPTLIIGANCISSEQQIRIRGGLSQTASYLSFGNVQILSRFLEHVWNKPQMSVDWWDTFDDLPDNSFIF